jgi:hypothetical protein
VGGNDETLVALEKSREPSRVGRMAAVCASCIRSACCIQSPAEDQINPLVAVATTRLETKNALWSSMWTHARTRARGEVNRDGNGSDASSNQHMSRMSRAAEGRKNCRVRDKSDCLFCGAFDACWWFVCWRVDPRVPNRFPPPPPRPLPSLLLPPPLLMR